MAALDRETTDQFSTIVVDNGSTDGSLRWLSHWAAEDRDRHILLQNPENLGFSSAVNRGIRFAVQKGFSYAILLNNDTEVFPDFVENLVRAMDQDHRGRLFALSSRMLQSSNPDTIDDAGISIPFSAGSSSADTGSPKDTFKNLLRSSPPARGRRSTASPSSPRPDSSMKPTSPISRISTSPSGPGSMALRSAMSPPPGYSMSVPGRAAAAIIPLRCGSPREIRSISSIRICRLPFSF
ncbi:MAG: glycosyltransferase [Oribacterium sp.]